MCKCECVSTVSRLYEVLVTIPVIYCIWGWEYRWTSEGTVDGRTHGEEQIPSSAPIAMGC